jgi:hypothetical protein
MIVIYDRSFIVLANGITIVNYDRKGFIVQATGACAIKLFTAVNIYRIEPGNPY